MPRIRIAIWVGVGLAIVAGFVHAALQVQTRQDEARQPDAPRFFRPFAHGNGRAGVDPLAPPGMPPGSRIDPGTGRITDWALPSTDALPAITWRLLGADAAPASVEDVPAAALAFVDRRVRLLGFVMPLDTPEAMERFLLVGSHLACCFGTWPGPGGMVEVRVGEGAPRVDPRPEPFVVEGVLRLAPVHDTWRGEKRVALLWRLDDARAEVLSRD